MSSERVPLLGEGQPSLLPETIDEVEVVAALASVLAGPTFAGAPRSRGLLAYIVTETLARRGDRLSEHAIARRALGRRSFDGRTDSSVRVQATRVRHALARHYAAEGASDEVRFALPAGSYVPVFSRRSAEKDPSTLTADPAVGVLRFASMGEPSGELVASTVSEAVSRHLADFPGLRVVGPATSTSTDRRTTAQRLGVRFLLEGGVTLRDSVVRLSARLTDASTDDLLWSTSDTLEAHDFVGFEVEDRWATAVAGELGDVAGVVFRREVRRTDHQHDSRAYAARLAHAAFILQGSPESVVAAAAALDLALETETDIELLVLRAVVHNGAAFERLGPDPAEDRRRAEELAREVLARDPGHAGAHLVLSTTARLRKQWDLAHRHAVSAVALGPSHPTNLVNAGMTMCLSGDWEGGMSVLREGFQLNPRYPGYVHAISALDCVLRNDDAGALMEADQIHSPGQPWGPMYRALALAGLGDLELAREEMAEVLRLEPSFLEDPLAVFEQGARLRPHELEVLRAHFSLFLD